MRSFTCFFSTAINIVLLLTIFSGCADNPEVSIKLDEVSTEAITSVEKIENTFGAVESMATSMMGLSGMTGGRIAEDIPELACASISIDLNDQGGIVTVDYGETGCELPDGHTVKGSVIIAFSSDWYKAGGVISVGFDGFTMDDFQLDGIQRITVLSASDTEIQYQIEVFDGMITWPDGAQTTWESDRTQTVITDLNSEDIVIQLDGELSGISAEGLGFETLITETLEYKSECIEGNSLNMPVSGKKTISLPGNPGAPVIFIDYGDGACNKTFTVTVGDESGSMTLEDLID